MRRILLLIFLYQFSFAQNDWPPPQLQVEVDSISLGEQFEVVLRWQHPSDLDVLFPLESHYFYPFNLKSYKALTTESSGGFSEDAIAYKLQCLSVDSVQILKLPLWFLQDQDSVAIYSEADTLFYKSIITDAELADQEYVWQPKWLEPVQRRVDLSFVLYLLAFVSIGAILAVLFRKPILRKYEVWKYAKKHKKFTGEFKKVMKNAENLDSSVLMWKEHMEDIEGLSYTTLSTREITQKTANKRLGEALRTVDKAVYGGEVGDELMIALQFLFNVANQSFKTKRKEFIKSLKNK